MADNIPNMPGGGVPPKPETSKIQPKKETVRINLPPKPSAAPTIKLPTLPPGGPTAPAPLPPPPTSSGRSAPVHAAGPATPAPAPRPSAPRSQPSAPRPAPQPTVSGLDKALAIVAVVAVLAAIGVTSYLTWFGFTPSPP